MPALSPARRHLGALAVALLLDAAFGEPPATRHPVVWIGRLIRLLERHAAGPAQGSLVPCSRRNQFQHRLMLAEEGCPG
jgi:hypothetical protein